MIIACLGDIDSGKSSLISRILINSGKINDREIKKEMNISKNWLPNIVDTDYNEQSRGITLYSSQEKFSIDNTDDYIIINNPGHKNLLNEIIINSSKADIAMLLISAKPNETDKNITQGYDLSLISRVNGIKHLIIVINKSEFIMSNNTYEDIVNKIKKSLKNQHYEKLTFIPVSAKLNLNISKPDSNIVNYCLFDVLKNIKINRRDTLFIKPLNNKIHIKLFFYNIVNIITSGHKCILCSLDKIYDIEFIDVQNGNLNFITKTNAKDKFINCLIQVNSNDHINQSVILLECNNILAYGILF